MEKHFPFRQIVTLNFIESIVSIINSLPCAYSVMTTKSNMWCTYTYHVVVGAGPERQKKIDVRCACIYYSEPKQINKRIRHSLFSIADWIRLCDNDNDVIKRTLAHMLRHLNYFGGATPSSFRHALVCVCWCAANVYEGENQLRRRRKLSFDEKLDSMWNWMDVRRNTITRINYIGLSQLRKLLCVAARTHYMGINNVFRSNLPPEER